MKENEDNLGGRQLDERERYIGEFKTMQTVWNAIVDLYWAPILEQDPKANTGSLYYSGRGGINFIVVISNDVNNETAFGEQYGFSPGDVIVPGGANEIDHMGWSSMAVTKLVPHHQLKFSTMNLPKGSTFKLIIDSIGKNKIAKVVVIKPASAGSSVYFWAAKVILR